MPHQQNKQNTHYKQYEIEEYNYLGGNINRDGNSSIEIKETHTKTAMTKLHKIWTDKQMTKTKHKFCLALDDIAKVNGFEMWV